MIDLCSDKNTCCGCGACKSICPKLAISMKNDEYGYKYPNIDSKLCIECHLCEKICAFKNTSISNKKPLRSYLAINIDTKDLLNSASGGAFAAIAKFVLNNNGVIVGCAWNNELKPEHILIDNYENLYKLQGSKYVQSDTEKIFKETKQLLINKKKVFFTGTPCQVAELKQYLGKDYNHLLTADIICHGVPNIEIFSSYIKWFEDKRKCKVLNVNFRDKCKLGWSSIGSITYQKNNKIKKQIILYNENPYYYLFEYGFILRDSCYNCKYACSDRKGDITLGDFWGVEKYYPELDKSKGVSALLVNTNKGQEIIEKLKDYIIIIPTKYKYIEENNDRLKYPLKQPKDRKIWVKCWKTGRFDQVARKFYKEKRNIILISKIKRNIPKGLKNSIKKIISFLF